jgi:hypothetical protein
MLEENTHPLIIKGSQREEFEGWKAFQKPSEYRLLFFLSICLRWSLNLLPRLGLELLDSSDPPTSAS